MRSAEEQLSRLNKTDSQALLQLVYDESEPKSTRVSGIGLLLTREIDDKTRLSLLKMEQVMTQFDLVEAQEREITAVTKKGRTLQERMKQGSIRVAVYRLEEIRTKIQETQV
jgi:hypothetical protein